MQGLCICRAFMCLSVCPSVCLSLSVRLSVYMCLSVPAQGTAAEFAAVDRPAADVDRLLHGVQQQRRANVGSATLSAYVGC